MKQAFDNVTPESLSMAMKEMGIGSMLAVMREQIGCRCEKCFQETRPSGVPFGRSITQGGKESPCLFDMMMKSVFRALQEKRTNKKIGVAMRANEAQKREM